MTFVPFHEAKDIGDRFLSLLSDHGINPPVGSSLEDELLSLTQLIEVMKNPNLVQGPNRVSILRSAAGLHDLAAKVLSVAPLPDFQSFLPHLRLISQTKVPAASLGQNAPSGPYDDTARKIAELYVGCLAAHVGTKVDLDSPTSAKGDNPDIVFTVEENCSAKQPKQWTLAIKTISSRQGQTIFERIKDGADQINRPKCKPDVGMVVMNAKSALDHDAFWNASFSDLQAAIDALNAQLEELADNAANGRPQTEWDEFVHRKGRAPGYLHGSEPCALAYVVTCAYADRPEDV